MCIDKLHLNSESKIINIGSGLSGPSRYFAHKIKAHIVSIELQEDLHRIATELTERCGLSQYVENISGDFLQVFQSCCHLFAKLGQNMKESHYTSIVSWLTVLHISNREKLFDLVQIHFYNNLY